MRVQPDRVQARAWSAKNPIKYLTTTVARQRLRISKAKFVNFCLATVGFHSYHSGIS
jgi:hypothetical protein